MDGINSALGTPKVKWKQQQMESLKDENERLRDEIKNLKQTIQITQE